MSPELIAFLRDWRAWATNGAPVDHPHFTRCCGLCKNLENYSNYDLGLLSELKHQLSTYTRYPFGNVNYYQRAVDNTQHKDPARLAWVDAALAQAEQDA